MSTPDTTRVRQRQRALKLNPPLQPAPVKVVDTADVTLKKGKLKEHANTYFTENKVMNAAKGKSEKARNALYVGMKELKLNHFECEGPDGKKLAADLSTPEGQRVDIVALSKLITLEQLLEVASVTQEAIKEKLGTAMLNQVLIATKGTENVKVKLA